MMKDREVTVGLLNGMYKMLTAGDYDLITDNVYKCPKKVADPMVRTFLGYGYMAPEVTIKILLACFELYKKYFQNVNSKDEFIEIIKEAEQIKTKFSETEEKSYAGKVLSIFIDEIELAYQASVNESNCTNSVKQ